VDELWTPEGSSPTETAQRELLLTRLVRDRIRWWNALEPSIAQHDDAVDVRRYSYAFPRWRERPVEITAAIEAWAAPGGEALVAAARAVLRAARHRSVEQLLVGWARDLGDVPRAKLYLQLAYDAGPSALALGRSLVGYRGPLASESLPLHLIGLDVGPAGLSGAKLYFLRREQDAATSERLTGISRALRDVLVIHRLRGPDDDSAAAACEIDFAPMTSELAWSDVWASAGLAPYAALRDRFAGLASRFALQPRRLSLATDGRRRATVYYVLDEWEGS
jgi:hypothetical protein